MDTQTAIIFDAVRSPNKTQKPRGSPRRPPEFREPELLRLCLTPAAEYTRQREAHEMSTAAPYPLLHSHLLIKRLLSLNKPSSLRPARHYIFLEGSKVECRHDSDRELPFEQERNFSWLSGGVAPPHSALTISYEHEGGEDVNFDAIETRLWLPEVDEAEVRVELSLLPRRPLELNRLFPRSCGWACLLPLKRLAKRST